MKTHQKIERLINDEHFNKAVLYSTGIFLLQSIIYTWWEQMEDELKRCDCVTFDFKFEMNACKKSIERFRRTLEQNMKNSDILDYLKEYDKVEPELRAFVFNEKSRIEL